MQYVNQALTLGLDEINLLEDTHMVLKMNGLFFTKMPSILLVK